MIIVPQSCLFGPVDGASWNHKNVPKNTTQLISGAIACKRYAKNQCSLAKSKVVRSRRQRGLGSVTASVFGKLARAHSPGGKKMEEKEIGLNCASLAPKLGFSALYLPEPNKNWSLLVA